MKHSPLKTLAQALVLAAAILAAPVLHGQALAEETKDAKDIGFSFEGAFGKFDQAQLKRGWQVYSEVCAACHSLKFVSYRNLADEFGPGFSKDEVKAIAAEQEVTNEDPDAEGEYFLRPAKPSDRVVSPFPNKQAAMASNNGALPPDLSLMTKARKGWHGTFNVLLNGFGGPNYVYSLLTGYEELPAHEEAKEGLNYNPYFPGHWIAMAPPLADGGVEYEDGTEATADQMARDVTVFLSWTAEPNMTKHKIFGIKAMILLSILALLTFMSYRVVWRKVKH